MPHPYMAHFRHDTLPYAEARVVQAFDSVAHEVDSRLEDSAFKNTLIASLWQLREEAREEFRQKTPWATKE